MPTYNAAAVSDATIAFQKPITLQQGRALRDNALAMFEGSAAAPRLDGKALARVGNGLAVLTIAAAATYVLEVGTGYVAGILSTASAVDVVGVTYTMPVYTGSARFNCSHAVSSGSGTSTLSLFKNGVLVISWNTVSLTPIARTVDVSFVPGDTLEWRHKQASGITSFIQSISVTGTDAYQNQLPVIKASAI